MVKNKDSKKWTRKDDMELIKLFNEGRSIRFVAEYFKVSTSSVSTRKSAFTRVGFINDKSLRSSFNIEITKEMKDAVQRFGKLSEIPEEWTFDWAERIDGNLMSIITKLERLYNEERK